MVLLNQCRAPALQRPTFTPCGENHSIWRITSQLMARMCSLRLCFKVPYAHRVFERSLVLANQTTSNNFVCPWLPLQSGIQKFEPPYIINNYLQTSFNNQLAGTNSSPSPAPRFKDTCGTQSRERFIISAPLASIQSWTEAATHDRSLVSGPGFIEWYPLVMTNIAMVFRWPIEIDSLPFLKMVIFHGYVKKPEGTSLTWKLQLTAVVSESYWINKNGFHHSSNNHQQQDPSHPGPTPAVASHKMPSVANPQVRLDNSWHRAQGSSSCAFKELQKKTLKSWING